MDLRNNYQGRSDDLETQFIPVQNTGRRSDQYDTQELSAAEIRRRAQQEQNGRAVRSRASGYQGTPPQRQNVPPVNPSSYPQQRPVQNPYQGSGGYPQQRPQQPMPQQRPQRPPVPPQHRPVQQRPVPSQQQRAPQRRSKQPPVWERVIKGILTLVIVVFIVYSAVALVGIFRTNTVATASRTRTDDAAYAAYTDNILIIGTDSRDTETDKGRSDSMILLSVNSSTNTVYMTSFLRDVYVYIGDDYGYGKLNSAYSYGGAELLMDTIESNYRIKIDDYVLVSFAACAAVIDSVGGVDIELSDDEATALNEILISEVNELMGDGRNDDLLDEGGTFTLNGKQALSYSRIRYVGNADFERTSRQREVLSLALKKACRNPIALGRIFMTALPELTTNISGLSLYGWSLRAPFLLMGYDIEQQQIPADGTFYSDTIDGQSVLVADFTENYNQLVRTIYSE